MTPRPKNFVEAEANLAADLPGYAPRATQQAFAAAVEQALDDYQHLLAQAGCGTGKSFGVLIPVILDGRRVVVSTATKALQNQYCVVPETAILTADLRYVRADEIFVGQHLLGFEEERVGNRRHYRDSVVESVEEIERPCYRLEFDDGTVIVSSSEHKWLVGKTMEVKWMTTKQLCPVQGHPSG